MCVHLDYVQGTAILPIYRPFISSFYDYVLSNIHSLMSIQARKVTLRLPRRPNVKHVVERTSKYAYVAYAHVRHRRLQVTTHYLARSMRSLADPSITSNNRE